MYNQPVYYYMLEGINKDWVTAQNAEAIYSYLPPGSYTFKVKCISPDGVPCKNITSFIIYIKPPFYKTWWFYLLCIVIISSAIYFIYRQRINKLLAVEKVRTRVARDLHDDMGSVLSTINILSTMAKTKMTDDTVKASEYIGKISDNSQRMMEAMDDIVWSIKPANDNMQKITARMREFATGILEAKDIELDFKADEKVNNVKLNMEARRDFFLIFKEAINNVAKYSHCSKCSIQISLHQHRLLLDVQDNGIGFDVNKADGGNGLSNMQKRAEALKGRVSIQSKHGEGTQVTLNLPVS
jgi:signal transduction histidine kinase